MKWYYQSERKRRELFPPFAHMYLAYRIDRVYRRITNRSVRLRRPLEMRNS